jgi:hypothetical protein
MTRGYGTLDVITLSGYGAGGGKGMTPQQKRFARAARRCSGDASCMSAALGGRGMSGYGRTRKRRKRRGLGILPHSKVAGTYCYDTKQVYSPYYGRKVTRCASYHLDADVYDYSAGGVGGRPGKLYKKGVWKSVYKRKKRGWPGGGTLNMECKAYKAKKSDKCRPRCASYGVTPVPAGAAKTPEAARAKCSGKRVEKKRTTKRTTKKKGTKKGKRR